MSEPNDDLKRQFLEVWASGVTRPEVAAHFGRTNSWVQYMTEVCDAPPRRVTIHNAGRVVGGAPDTRIQRRAHYKVANELKRSIHNLYGRLHEMQQLEAASVSAGVCFASQKGFNRLLTNIRIGVRTTNRRAKKLHSVSPDDPIISNAESITSQALAEYNRWLSAKYASERGTAR